jgi:hypothetical protein
MDYSPFSILYSQFNMAHSSRHVRRGSLDMDEIAPNHFLLHNSHVINVLKGEGHVKGRLFELTTWRREGLLARLRERGFTVRTIADRLEGLPQPPAPPAIGGAGWRPLTHAIEQISNFDLRRLRWHPLLPQTRDGVTGVEIYDGWPLRRRKGRGSASYFLAFKERGGGIGLRSLDETTAVLIGIAQSLEHDPRPLLVEPKGESLLLPDIELPPAYRDTLALFSRSGTEGALVDRQGWPLAQELFGRLGIGLTIDDDVRVR